MVIKARTVKPSQPAPEIPMEWTRADPAALDLFDPATKTCTMNCGPHGLDPRSRKERLFLCDDCDCHAAPHELKGIPPMSSEPTTAIRVTAKQRAWFKAFQERTGSHPLGLDHLQDGAMTFAESAQYSIKCFLSEAEEMAQGLERDLQPLIAGE